MTTQAYIFVVDAGVIKPDTTELREGMADNFRAALGQSLSVEPTTIQGILIDLNTQGLDTIVTNNPQLANQINPDVSGGVHLESILGLHGIERKAAQPSTVELVLTGTQNTLVPAGSQIQSTLNSEIFSTTANATIGISGTTSVSAQSINTGAIAVDANTVSQILSVIPGWDTANNPTAGTVGEKQQSDASVKNERKGKLAVQGINHFYATLSKLRTLDGVISAQGLENPTEAPVVKEGIFLKKNSAWYCVVGDPPTDQLVAETIFLSDGGTGCQFNGAITVPITDAYAGVQYDVLFDRGTAVNINVRITVENTSNIPNLSIVVSRAVLKYIEGEVSGFVGWKLGTDVSAFDLADAVREQIDGLLITKAEIALDGNPFSTDPIQILINQIAVTSDAFISVVST